MSKSLTPYLNHILEETSFLVSVLNNGQTLKGFINDETLKRAVVRSIEIIGEASKKIPSSFKQHHSSIEWKNMAGMRDRLIHNYMGVDYSIVWDVLKTRIPILHLQIKTLLDEID